MIEEWREIPGFSGNEASNTGFVRTYWYKVRNSYGRGFHRELRDTPRLLHGSLNGGYLQTSIYSPEREQSFTRKIHVLVGYTWLPLPDDFDEVDYTIDHIRSGAEYKLDNSITNLCWLPRPDNVRKAYEDGLHDDRIRASRRDVVVVDDWFNRDLYFESIGEAARWIGVHYTTISHALSDQSKIAGRYYIYDPGREDRLLYANDEYETYQLFSWL